jgi:proline dehydrogenase
MARRFVAGETLAAAIAAVQSLNAQGMLATLDHLGENVANEAEATAAADEYLVALDALYLAQAQCNVSVKLTQMGLDLGDDFCYANVSRIVLKAAELGNFVRVDMEGSPYTERTLALYRRLRTRFSNTGIVIQAYLHRSQADVEALIAEGIGHFRLCKGAYDEPATIAYRERPRVTQALNELTRACLAPAGRAKGAYAAVASHDEEVINFTRAYAYQHDIPPAAYEFQMLYGIRRELQTELVKRGYRMRVYVPYGTHWYPYYMRRLAERPANLLFFLRAWVGK